MKNFIKILGLATMLAVSSVSCASSYQSDISALRTEVHNLQDSVHKYSESMYEQYVTSVNRVVKQQKELIENLNDKKVKERLNLELISVEKKLNELNNPATNNKESIYKAVIMQLKNLNESIAKAYS